jgi:monoamine oxidase
MKAIVRNSNNTFTLTFDAPEGTVDIVADHVIMAIPFSVLRTILTTDAAYRGAGFNSLKQTAITQLGYGKNAKLQLQFDTRYWRQSGHPWGVTTGTSFSDTGYQNSWDVTRGQAGATGILVDYTGGGVPLASFTGNPNDPAVVEQFARTFLDQIEDVFPGVSRHWNGRATLDVPLTNPNLLGSYSYWKVGQYTKFSGYEGVRQGNCHFAGEHCSSNFQGFMEGGAEEGQRAAQEILTDYGIPF